MQYIGRPHGGGEGREVQSYTRFCRCALPRAAPPSGAEPARLLVGIYSSTSSTTLLHAATFLQEPEKCGNMQRAQRSSVSILLVGFYSSRILLSLATCTTAKRDSEMRDKIGLISRLTENTMQNEWLLERARARA